MSRSALRLSLHHPACRSKRKSLSGKNEISRLGAKLKINQPITLDEVALRLDEAFRTLGALPGPDARFTSALRAKWPDLMRTPMEQWATALEQVVVEVGRQVEEDKTAARGFDPPPERKPRPSAKAIDRMIPTLGWLQWLHLRQRRLIWLRAKGWPWWRVAGRLRVDEKTAEDWYWMAISRIRYMLLHGEKPTTA